jgi:hypothetical protein
MPNECFDALRWARAFSVFLKKHNLFSDQSFFLSRTDINPIERYWLNKVDAEISPSGCA